MTVRAFLVGLGPIGLEVGRALVGRGIEIVGAADPALAGQDLGELLAGTGTGTGTGRGSVHPSTSELYAGRSADVCVLCTGSRMPQVAAQIEEALAARLHVISTCEELAFPALRHPRLASDLDGAARARGLTIAGTGVNPGLVMDRLPITLAEACATVEHVAVERVVDAARRRGPLRAKVGAGLSVADFQQGVAAGRLGHVGLAESAALIAAAIGWPHESVDETLEPVLDGAGTVLGVRQTARIRVPAAGAAAGRERVRLQLEMFVGAEPQRDRIVIAGDPPLDVTVAGGIHGDRATVGAMVNLVARVEDLGRGLVTAATGYR